MNSSDEQTNATSAVLEEARELARGAEVLPGIEHLASKLAQARKESRPLRVKLGVDPTGSDLHLGHAVVLRALRRFQDAGHEAILVTGGFTAMIGDPTGRNTTRPPLSKEAVAENAKTFLKQVSSILDMPKLTVVNNADWLSTMSTDEMIKLASSVTVSQLLAKEDFRTRLEKRESIALHELFYPVLQGFDSVVLKADVEIGGSDQRFNVLQGREMQASRGQNAQVALLLPILEGTDGVRKMSKTFDNFIGLQDTPDDMFAKVMRIPDPLIIKFFELATSLKATEIEANKAELAAGSNPKDAKEKLAHQIVLELHGMIEANSAQSEWQKIHSQRLAPDSMPEFKLHGAKTLVELLVAATSTESNTQARNLITHGAVSLDGEKILDPKRVVTLAEGESKVLKVGRKLFVRLVS